MTLPLSTLLSLFGFARPAGGDHAPKEDSAVRLARKKRNVDLKIGKLGDNAASGYISVFIYTI